MSNAARRTNRGIRPLLLLGKMLGLTGFLGALAALAAMVLLGPEPETLAQWRTLRAAMRSIFLPCLFGGLLLAIAMGITLFLQHPGAFTRLRWFRLKIVLLAVAVPAMHLWARGLVLAFDAALEEGRLDTLPAAWRRIGVAFAVGLVVFLTVAAIGRTKPRLGERPGRRRPATKRAAERPAPPPDV